jgi:hypothetical protein
MSVRMKLYIIAVYWSGENDLKSSVTVFRMILEAGVGQLVELSLPLMSFKW